MTAKLLPHFIFVTSFFPSNPSTSQLPYFSLLCPPFLLLLLLFLLRFRSFHVLTNVAFPYHLSLLQVFHSFNHLTFHLLSSLRFLLSLPSSYPLASSLPPLTLRLPLCLCLSLFLSFMITLTSLTSRPQRAKKVTLYRLRG